MKTLPITRHRLTSILFLFAYLCWLPALAKPEITIHTRYFPVSGHDSPSIQSSIQRSGPMGNNGIRYHAHTQKDIKWDYRWIESGSICHVTRIRVSIEVEYLLPQLQSEEKLTEETGKLWNDYYQALLKHEEQHKELGIQAAYELEKELSGIGQLACIHIHTALQNKASQILQKYDDMDKEYDLKTGHGIHEGIILP